MLVAQFSPMLSDSVYAKLGREYGNNVLKEPLVQDGNTADNDPYVSFSAKSAIALAFALVLG